MLAYGSSGMIGRDVENDQEVWKCPIQYDTPHEVESYSARCMDREGLIYRQLPRHENVLQCLQVSEVGIRFPYMQHGNLRAFCQTRCISDNTKGRWIRAATAATAHLHAHGVIHADISPRNVLIADDLTLQLCDFGGSGFQDLPSIAEEEDHYRIFPGTPRSFQTDVYALGCLMYEIAVGTKPYAEIDDENWEQIASNYAAGRFPRLDGLKYQRIIQNCWTFKYTDARQVLVDLQAMEPPVLRGRPQW
ncbi:kinase-like protein [Aspergillus indologenus CBS 114.80]|uniref:EKC/KEOPS complex subunit BUD32 n=1 Tax=Aspergillus indologenus CBS 114.80 TaxID=1450541 RepID=A0A2V5IZ81_9EURO|nr:kinase-like protein [Aspergillus indologenus CBS 114.80]